MCDDLQGALAEVVEEVFGALAFMMPMDGELADDVPPAQGSWTAVAVAFDGPSHGSLTLRIERRTMPELAANMLGLDEQVPSIEQQADALEELVNVLCGNLLPRLAGEQAEFRVHPPRTLHCPGCPVTFAGEDVACTHTFAMDEGWIEVALHLNPCPAPAA